VRGGFRGASVDHSANPSPALLAAWNEITANNTHDSKRVVHTHKGREDAFLTFPRQAEFFIRSDVVVVVTLDFPVQLQPSHSRVVVVSSPLVKGHPHPDLTDPGQK
jgi:hypothetical protein